MNQGQSQPAYARPLVAVLGAGIVGRTLARGWALAGYDVILGSRTPGSGRIKAAVAEVGAGVASRVSAATQRDAAHAVDVVVVTVPGDQVAALVADLGTSLEDKITIDASNNTSTAAVALNSLDTLRNAGAICFRAYNTVGWEQMARPIFGHQRADMLFTGPDSRRDVVARLIADTGFRPIHLGDDDRAVDAVDAQARLWFLLAFERGYGRRLGFRVLTEADESLPDDGEH